MKKQIVKLTKLEEAIRELYYDIISEADYNIGHYWYHFIWEGPDKGYNVYIEDENNKEQWESEYFEDICPYEHFKDKEELITKFKIKEDGRTFLEYVCDQMNEPRLLILPKFEDLQNRLEKWQ